MNVFVKSNLRSFDLTVRIPRRVQEISCQVMPNFYCIEQRNTTRDLEKWERVIDPSYITLSKALQCKTC